MKVETFEFKPNYTNSCDGESLLYNLNEYIHLHEHESLLFNLHVFSFTSCLCLLFQLSRSCHAAVLPARWTDGPPHWRLQSWPLNGDLPRVTQLQGADALPRHHVSTRLSPLIYTECTSEVTEWPKKKQDCGYIALHPALCVCVWPFWVVVVKIDSASVDQYWLKRAHFVFTPCPQSSQARKRDAEALRKLFQCKLSYPCSYCSPEYTFPRQQEVINFAASTAFELVTLNPRTLVVCGSYSVGKEKVFLGECLVEIILSASAWSRGSTWDKFCHDEANLAWFYNN